MTGKAGTEDWLGLVGSLSLTSKTTNKFSLEPVILCMRKSVVVRPIPTKPVRPGWLQACAQKPMENRSPN